MTETTETRPQKELPRYRCHKEVWALKIKSVINVTLPGEEDDGDRLLEFEDEGYAPFAIDAAYVQKHSPQPGGYYVVYKDGYRSFSPAEAFEDGYILVA